MLSFAMSLDRPTLWQTPLPNMGLRGLPYGRGLLCNCDLNESTLLFYLFTLSFLSLYVCYRLIKILFCYRLKRRTKEMKGGEDRPIFAHSALGKMTFVSSLYDNFRSVKRLTSRLRIDSSQEQKLLEIKLSSQRVKNVDFLRSLAKP